MANETPNEDLFREDPLEQLLDEESDEEFGLPQFKEHFADSLTPAVLKDWTAKDFASIYVRFRPHLERHARRFLVNPSQVEEVVQDAFLYLMTTLPELDSELGVLRFLKWKVRLLALDVIRANSRATMAPLDDQPEMAANLPEMSEGLEHADDAAIVSLALAKLQPRQREALIATLYEEKSTEVVAAQMGLSENAFRQLLFRSRASFKKALVGEAETAGKSISQILSIAARKAAAESGNYVSSAGAFLLVLAIAVGVLPNLSSQVPLETVALPEPVITSPQTPTPKASAEVEAVATEDPGQQLETAVAAPTALQISPASVIVKAEEPVDEDGAAAEPDILRLSMETQLGELAVRTLASASLTEVSSFTPAAAGAVTLTNDKGLSAKVAYDLGTQNGIQHSWITFNVRGKEFVAVPRLSYVEKIVGLDGSVTLSYIATDLTVGDRVGDYGFLVLDSTEISKSGIEIKLELDTEHRLVGSSLRLIPRG